MSNEQSATSLPLSAKSREAQAVWERAARLVEQWEAGAAKADGLIQAAAFDSAVERRRCQHLFYGVVRWHGAIEALLEPLLQRAPRPRLSALLKMAIFELIEGRAEAGLTPRIIDNAVAQTKRQLSQPEAGMVNAVLRRVAREVGTWKPGDALDAAGLAGRWSHPEAMVVKWLQHFGKTRTLALLEWNQQVPEVILRLRDPAARDALRELTMPTPWRDFYRLLPEADWAHLQPLLEAGRVYAQDPSTRLAPQMLNPRPGEDVLDLCAAPGGKTLQLADLLFGHGSTDTLGDKAGLLVSLDLPELGHRSEQWQRNLAPYPPEKIRRLEHDLLALTPDDLRAHGLPRQFDAILLDAPCSNSGVLRRRPDAKRRLSPESVAEMAALQHRLLSRAAALVKPGGRLVYSTCSIEPEENRQLIDHFLNAAAPDFALVSQTLSLPWETGHDGADVFLLKRNRA